MPTREDSMPQPRLVRLDFAGSSNAENAVQRDIEVDDPGIRSLTEHVMDVLRPLRPRETDRADVFAITDPEIGDGTAALVNMSKDVRAEVRDAVRTLEIAELVGETEAFRQEVLGVDQVMRPRTTNPYFLIITGWFFIALFGWALGSAVMRDLGTYIVVLLVIAVIVALAVGGWLIASGARRVVWWHRARAAARAAGRDLPRQLRVWN